MIDLSTVTRGECILKRGTATDFYVLEGVADGFLVFLVRGHSDYGGPVGDVVKYSKEGLPVNEFGEICKYHDDVMVSISGETAASSRPWWQKILFYPSVPSYFHMWDEARRFKKEQKIKAAVEKYESGLKPGWG